MPLPRDFPVDWRGYPYAHAAHVNNPGVATQFVHQVHHPHLDPRLGHANGAQEFPALLMGLRGKDMLDAGTAIVGGFLGLLMNATAVTPLSHQDLFNIFRAIGAIGEDLHADALSI